VNSLKKLALVTAAALTGSLLSVAPASAVPTIAVSVAGTAVTTAAAAATPATVTVPADNSVDAADAVKFELTGVETGTVVSAVAANALIVPALATLSAPVTASAGSAALTINTGTGTTATFFVFTKNTVTGSVVITNGGNTWTFYVKGTAGAGYNLEFAPAATGNTSSVVKVKAKVTDVFGNAVAGVTPTSSAVNLTVGAIAATAVDGTTEVTLTYPATAGQAAVSLAITATDVVGLPVAVKNVTKFIEVADLATLLAAEKAARAADKVVADKALSDEKAAHEVTKKALANVEVKAKADADAAKAAAADAKAAADKVSAELTTKVTELTSQVAALTKSLDALKKKYNAKAKKFKFAAVK